MTEIEFMRWLISQGIFECSSPYRSTFDPIRGFWSIDDDCNKRKLVFFDTSFNEVYSIVVNTKFSENVEKYRKEILKIFEL